MRSATPNRQSRSIRLALLKLAGSALAPTVTTLVRQPRRVLLLRPDHIGDVLLTAPAVALVRRSLPDAHLTYVVGGWSAEAARHGPAVDEVRTLAYPGFTRHARSSLLQPYALLLREAARLRREGFQLAVVLRPDHWWGALLALVAGIPVRVGGRTPETAPILTHAYTPPVGQHWADTARAIARLAVEAVGAVPEGAERLADEVTQFHVSEIAKTTARDLWRRVDLDGKRVVAIHPTAGAALKSWPLASWARLADSLIDEGLGVLLVGAPDDRSLLSAIQSRMAHSAATACGQNLSVSAAIYQGCAVVVTVDSGAGHLAAAVGTPTIRLYGPAPPAVFGPWPARADQHVLINKYLRCAPCGDLELPPCGARTLPACMQALSVDAVANTVKAQLKQS